MDSEKYLKQIEAIEQMAKEDSIQLLKNNPKGRYIEFDINIDEEYDAYYDSIIDAVTSDNEFIVICAVGLDDNDHLIFKAESYNDDKWFFEELSNPPYAEIYWFVAQNLQYAKKEPLDKEDE
jgi:hypothetical protein